MACEKYFLITLDQLLETGLGLPTDMGCPLEPVCDKANCQLPPTGPTIKIGNAPSQQSSNTTFFSPPSKRLN